MNVQIDLGGDGQAEEHALTIKGCACRTNDFVFALIQFANDWKREADLRTEPTAEIRPCGCNDDAK